MRRCSVVHCCKVSFAALLAALSRLCHTIQAGRTKQPHVLQDGAAAYNAAGAESASVHRVLQCPLQFAAHAVRKDTCRKAVHACCWQQQAGATVTATAAGMDRGQTPSAIWQPGYPPVLLASEGSLSLVGAVCRLDGRPPHTSGFLLLPMFVPGALARVSAGLMRLQ